MSEVYRVWFRKAAALKPGERIFLPVESKNDGTHINAILRKEQEAFARIDADEAASVLVTPNVLRDGRLWIILRKLAYSPLVGYMKSNDEAVPTKVKLETNETRLASIGIRVREGCTLEEIEGQFGALSDDEKRYFGLEDSNAQSTGDLQEACGADPIGTDDRG